MPSYGGRLAKKQNSETSGVIFYFMNPWNCGVNNSKWTHSETRTIAAKGQSLVVETATAASWFQPPGARPANWGNDPEGFDLPQCSTYVKSVCHSSARTVPQKAKRCAAVLASKLHRQRETHISSAFTNFLCELANASFALIIWKKAGQIKGSCSL